MNPFERPNIVMIGGGSGSSTLLYELKKGTPNITALVSMSDDGGSTGRLRQEYGVLPPGDLRQCLTALSNAPEISDRFSYRYDDGPLKCHSFGNLILARLELDGGIDYAVRTASELLDITGKVIPITVDNHDLVMADGGDIIRGEDAIIHRAKIISREPEVWLDPPAVIHPDAEAAIAAADVVAIAPGNFYGSLLPALVVGGVADALRASSARKVMVANLLTQPGQTDGWHVADYVAGFERFIGEGLIDAVLYNNQLPRPDMLAQHANPGEQPLSIVPEGFSKVTAQPIADNLLASEIFETAAGDPLQRTKIRHDAVRVAEHLLRLCRETTPV